MTDLAFLKDLFAHESWPQGLDMMPRESQVEIFGFSPDVVFGCDQIPLCQMGDSCCKNCSRPSHGSEPNSFINHCCFEEFTCDLMACEILVPLALFMGELFKPKTSLTPLPELAKGFAVDIHTINLRLATWWQRHWGCVCKGGESA